MEHVEPPYRPTPPTYPMPPRYPKHHHKMMDYHKLHKAYRHCKKASRIIKHILKHHCHEWDRSRWDRSSSSSHWRDSSSSSSSRSSQ
jgi:hypothetical protein